MANGDGTHRLLSFNELGLLLRGKNCVFTPRIRVIR